MQLHVNTGLNPLNPRPAYLTLYFVSVVQQRILNFDMELSSLRHPFNLICVGYHMIFLVQFGINKHL